MGLVLPVFRQQPRILESWSVFLQWWVVLPVLGWMTLLFAGEGQFVVC